MMRMSAPDPDSNLNDINYNTYKKLVLRLNQNDAWREVAAIIPIFGTDDIEEFERCTSPSSELLRTLDNKLCNVGMLCELLTECHLFEALSLIAPPRPLHIEQQPGEESDEDIFVSYEGQLRLEVVASGIPPPQYLWHHENEELLDQRSSVLIIDNFMEDSEGEYRCLITQEDSETREWSYSVFAKIHPVPLCIVQQPDSVRCQMGESVTLTCECEGYPFPSYKWIHKNEVLQEDSNKLHIPNATFKDEGEYVCCIYNEFDEIYTDRITINVYESPPVPDETFADLEVIEKVALLIANDDYSDYVGKLRTPQNDVITLSEILTKLHFKVVALYNLTLLEMKNAVRTVCKMIPENAHVLFYFVGHGIEITDRYMLPVDTPNKYAFQDILSEREVICEVLKEKPKLFFIILDMCLKRPDKNENPDIYLEAAPAYTYEPGRNMIQAYATTSNLGAYERMTEENGIYMKHLKRYLNMKLPIIQILANVNESMETDSAADKQVPSYTNSVIVKNHYLTCPAEGYEDAEAMFSSYNELQSPMRINFKHIRHSGIVSFHRYKNCFQNVMEIRTEGLEKWRVLFSTPCKELKLESAMNGNNPGVYVHNLQKLKMQFTLNISLTEVKRVGENKKVYTLIDNGFLELEESPLIASAQLWFNPSLLEEIEEDLSTRE